MEPFGDHAVNLEKDLSCEFLLFEQETKICEEIVLVELFQLKARVSHIQMQCEARYRCQLKIPRGPNRKGLQFI